jgi:hypothetical protein
MSSMAWSARREAVYLLVAVLCLDGCASKTDIKPVVKPTAAEWAALKAAKVHLTQAQQNLTAQQKRLSQATAVADSVQGGNTLYQPLLSQLRSVDSDRIREAANSVTTQSANQVAQARTAVDQASQAVTDAQQQVTDTNSSLDSKTRGDFETQFATVLSDCKKIINQYQGESRDGAKVAFWLQISGLVAGAVAAPALVAASSVGNKAWIAGISGYAGGTNMAESSLGAANLNGVADATTASSLVTQIRSDITAALTKTTWDDKYDGLNAVVADCSLFQIGVPSAQPNNGFGGNNGNSNSTPPPAAPNSGGS